MLFGKKKMLVDIYINYGNDLIRHHRANVSREVSVIDVLKSVAEIDYFPDESASGHNGAMVIAIDGTRANISNCWIYYIFERDRPGWHLPKEMPDKIKVTEGMRIGWRYYNYVKDGLIPAEGPLSTSQCKYKIKTCAHSFS